MDNQMAVFRGKGIRRTLHKNEWWFVVEDVVLALIESNDAKQYIQRMKQRDAELGKGWVQIVHTLDIPTEGGNQKMNCANTEGIFRIIQSVPSPKAEPFKRWLARVGYERVQEIEDPELGTKRTRALFRAKGYSDEWIEKRMRGIAIREELTDEWKKRDVEQPKEYEILTAEIAKAAFGVTPPPLANVVAADVRGGGVTPSAHKKIKGLDRENLRDHMTDLELIFTMLGEASTTAIAKADDARGFGENRSAAVKGGGVAGKARKDLEKKTGKHVVSPENYLTEPENRKRLERKESSDDK